MSKKKKKKKGQFLGGVPVNVAGKAGPRSAGRAHVNTSACFAPCVSCNTCTHTVCPSLNLTTEGHCVLYCREWKMPFTLWYGRSGRTGSISSARKKRLRAVSSLKSVLWCERGKCMQPCAHRLRVCVLLVGIVAKGQMGEGAGCELALHGFWTLTCWFLLGLWWSSNRRPPISSFLSISVVDDYCLRPYSHWVCLCNK